MGYQPSLDGIRAIAVVAVLLYHADVRWLPGGFLGVDVFFVVSGYLITSLLVEERRGSMTTDLKRFWLRRAKRLLPALFRHAGRDLRLRRGRGARRAVPAAHRCPRRGDVLDQLVADRQQAALLRGPGPAPAAAAPVVPRGRGAVVPPVAAGVRARRGTRAGADRAPRRADRRRRPGVHGVDGDRLRPCGRRFARLLRHRHPRVGPAHRRGCGDGLDAVAVAVGRSAPAGRPRRDRLAGAALARRRHARVGPDDERALPRGLPVGLRAVDRGGGRLRPPGRHHPPGRCSRWRRCAGWARAATGSTCGTGRSSW